jgi:hypothetical protein
MDHTFVVPVFSTAPTLGSLVDSLRIQVGTPSEILLTTSTPSGDLEAFAKSHALRLLVNSQNTDIASDWNFALRAATTQFVTLAHQDDFFGGYYVSRMRTALRAHPEAVLAFCDYSEHSPRGTRPTNLNLWIKRARCRRAFGARECITDLRDKLRLLSLGNPICCPSVMFDRSAIPDFRFPVGFRTNLDWMAWLELARRPGGFVYIRDRLVSKGVHAQSATTATIADRTRQQEDRALFDELWPRPMAAVIAAIYRLSYLANRL